MAVIRVLVADDDLEVLSALVDILRSDERFAVVGTATNGSDACRLAGERHADVILLDVRMPGGGAAAAATLQRLPNPPAVVVLSAQTAATTVAEVVRAGAVGYFAKGRIGAVLPDLLARCADGEVVLAVSTAAQALRILLREPSRS